MHTTRPPTAAAASLGFAGTGRGDVCVEGGIGANRFVCVSCASWHSPGSLRQSQRDVKSQMTTQRLPDQHIRIPVVEGAPHRGCQALAYIRRVK